MNRPISRIKTTASLAARSSILSSATSSTLLDRDWRELQSLLPAAIARSQPAHHVRHSSETSCTRPHFDSLRVAPAQDRALSMLSVSAAPRCGPRPHPSHAEAVAHQDAPAAGLRVEHPHLTTDIRAARKPRISDVREDGDDDGGFEVSARRAPTSDIPFSQHSPGGRLRAYTGSSSSKPIVLGSLGPLKSKRFLQDECAKRTFSQAA
ncbi:hypothetical protein C8J57DRAFT_1234090 [Mycena rebaudengoi]|nr:hypothetical protein C8J57DRAFT_1234090 [Mycena rebaudengoi]